MVTIYLIHIDPPYRHFRHYAGGTSRAPETRFLEHLGERGARLCKLAIAAGSKLSLVRTWPNQTWDFEKKLKKRNLKELCPVCSPKARALMDAEEGQADPRQRVELVPR